MSVLAEAKDLRAYYITQSYGVERTVKAVDDISIQIKEGEILLLPAGIPHSPRRPADTVGLVVERQRRDGEIDQLLWFCDGCETKLHREAFHLKNIEEDLIPAIKNYYARSEKHRCPNCGQVDSVPV